ncbi:hypothetical protein, partial [Streptomyces sp. NPDC060198]|uniref:hypothetical protein n=1 Tax=Streptomyces sp. NPDC060198 TaxID=3347070 RepID=UPI003667B89C
MTAVQHGSRSRSHRVSRAARGEGVERGVPDAEDIEAGGDLGPNVHVFDPSTPAGVGEGDAEEDAQRQQGVP